MQMRTHLSREICTLTVAALASLTGKKLTIEVVENLLRGKRHARDLLDRASAVTS